MKNKHYIVPCSKIVLFYVELLMILYFLLKNMSKQTKLTY